MIQYPSTSTFLIIYFIGYLVTIFIFRYWHNTIYLPLKRIILDDMMKVLISKCDTCKRKYPKYDIPCSDHITAFEKLESKITYQLPNAFFSDCIIITSLFWPITLPICIVILLADYKGPQIIEWISSTTINYYKRITNYEIRFKKNAEIKSKDAFEQLKEVQKILSPSTNRK